MFTLKSNLCNKITEKSSLVAVGGYSYNKAEQTRHSFEKKNIKTLKSLDLRNMQVTSD